MKHLFFIFLLLTPLISFSKELNQWQVSGKISLSENTGIFMWEHHPNQNKINLKSPLGITLAKISYIGNQLSIETKDNTLNHGESLHWLQTQNLNIPLNSLHYWIQGQQDPTLSTIKTDKGFIQSNWKINYKRWQTYNCYQLPKIIAINNENLKIKLGGLKWKLPNTTYPTLFKQKQQCNKNP